MRNFFDLIKKYCAQSKDGRRNFLFQYLETYANHESHQSTCECCNVCFQKFNCGKCKENKTEFLFDLLTLCPFSNKGCMMHNKIHAE